MYQVPTKKYFVYILSNRSKTLYIGVTNNLRRRISEYKHGTGSGFASKYKLDRLVYFERYSDVHRAIAREKQLKGWRRLKKIALIVALNPAWKDLSGGWYERHRYQPEVHRSFDSVGSFASE
ncbi:MAG TPA: GIY-YIG nuclease family protein [Terriglobales bacterium]|nr:GIY-YIG nuclease family protein [Terriglobales bacterium]